MRRTERETRPCINPSHFQSEKWQPPRDGGVGQNTRYLHAYVSGDVWSASGTFLRETDRSIPPAAPGFLTAIWHGKHYNVTHRTPCFPTHILFPPFFLPENSFDMCLPDFLLVKKLKKIKWKMYTQSYTYYRMYYCVFAAVIQFDLCRSDVRSNRWQVSASRLIVVFRGVYIIICIMSISMWKIRWIDVCYLHACLR